MLRIDPTTGTVTELDLALGISRDGVPSHAYANGSLWASGGPFRDTVVEIDPVTMTEVRRIQLPNDHNSRHAGTALWLTTRRGVRSVDMTTAEVGELIELPVDPAQVLSHGTDLWVSLPMAAQLARIDTTTGGVELIDTEPGPSSLSLHNGIVWVGHPPTGSVSRIDASTGEVLGVTDVDIGGDSATTTSVRGVQPTADGVWVFVRFDGTPYLPALVRLDPDSGTITGARTVQIEGNTWEARDGELWMHHSRSESLLAVDVAGFGDAPQTPIDDLALLTPAAPQPGPTDDLQPSDDSIDATVGADIADVTVAFERFIDLSVPSGELGIGPLDTVRDQLLELLDAQPDGEARLTDVTVIGDTAAVTFDVVTQGDTVLLPGLEFVFRRTSDTAPWSITTESLCVVATGVGIACP